MRAHLRFLHQPLGLDDRGPGPCQRCVRRSLFHTHQLVDVDELTGLGVSVQLPTLSLRPTPQDRDWPAVLNERSGIPRSLDRDWRMWTILA